MSLSITTLTTIGTLISLNNYSDPINYTDSNPSSNWSGPILTLDLGALRSSSIWTATGTTSNQSIRVRAQVPGGIYSDLEAAGYFSSPIYVGFSDQETRWVALSNWTFSREFNVSAELLKKSVINLKLEGLDTISTIYINDLEVNQTLNMFVRYTFNIKPFLKKVPSQNTLKIEFQSPITYAEEEYLKQSLRYEVPPTKVPLEYRGFNHVNHIRKMQASFSWDWGPAYPSVGIWRGISVEGYSSGVIMDARVFLKKTNAANLTLSNLTSWDWEVRVKVDLQVAPSPSVQTFALGMTLSTNGEVKGQTKEVILPSSLESKSITEELTLHVKGSEVDLWWPNGYGNQPLYHLNLTLMSKGTSEIQSRSLRLGFRTIELVQEYLNLRMKAKGRLFYFLVNGKAVFIKGSNFIPVHILPENVTPDSTKWLLESAKETHTNMLRVWGGGIYESDLFYDLADEYGILIWQDFMFACGMYPSTPSFLGSVSQEVVTQVKRLQHHACIAIWAANNENEAALRGNWYNTQENYSLYYEDYIKLYVDTVIQTVEELDPSRECLSSSPTNGKESEKEGFVARNPYSSLYGDTHFYNYVKDGWDFKIYPFTRFASEYGFQSWPHPALLKAYFAAEDLKYNSYMMLHRQHHPGGEHEIISEIKSHLPLPLDYNSTKEFDLVLYLAQINQAMSIKIETEAYRRQMSILDVQGRGLCMGALYWQLNDIWPGASWASIESQGRWKILHYFSQSFFAPVLTSLSLNYGDVSISIINDGADNSLKFKGNLRVRLLKLDSLGFDPLLDYKVPVTAGPLTSREVERLNASTIYKNCPNLNCLVYTTLPSTPDNFLFLKYPKDKEMMMDPELKMVNITHKETEEGQKFEIKLRVKSIALFVSLTYLDNDVRGRFSESGFHIIRHGGSRINFYNKYKIYNSSKVIKGLGEFRENLEIRSLYGLHSTS